MDFKYSPCFQIFFKENKKDINNLIYHLAMKYQDIVEIEDTYQEIILGLAQSNFLERYDYKGASLKTYFYYQIRGYANHFIKRILKKPKFIPIDTQLVDYNDEEQHNVDYPTAQSSDETIEKDIYSEEIMAILQEKLDETDYTIACLYFLDCYTCKEIRRIIKGCSYNTILRRMNKIKRIIKNTVNAKNLIYT